MRPLAYLSILVLLAACSKDSSGPQGLDPIVVVQNKQNAYPVTMTWFDQSNQTRSSVVPDLGTLCIKFTAMRLADSVRFVIVAGDSTQPGIWSALSSPWFDPSTGVTGADPKAYPHGAEFWNVMISPGPSIQMTADSVAPC